MVRRLAGEKRLCGEYSGWRTRTSGARRPDGRNSSSREGAGRSGRAYGPDTAGLPRAPGQRRPNRHDSAGWSGPGKPGWANGSDSSWLQGSSRIRWQNGGNTSWQARGSGRARSHAEQVASTDHSAKTANAHGGQNHGPLSWQRQTCCRPPSGPSSKPHLRDSSHPMSGDGSLLPGMATTPLARRYRRVSHRPPLGIVPCATTHTGGPE